MPLQVLAQDTRYALRTLARSPGYAAAAVLTLALGIGANTAIVSAIDEILFRPPDLPRPGRLAQVYSFSRKASTYLSSSYPDYLDLRQRSRSFENLAAYVRFPLNVQLNGGAAERVSVEAVSGNYFAMLGVPPLAGRAFRVSDDVPGAAPVALIGEDLWRTRLQADSGVLGREIEISGRQFTVIGIVPKRVTGLNLNWVTPPRIWIPLRATALVIPRFDRVFDSRAAAWLVLTGRLNAGVSTSTAQAELQTIAAQIAGKRDLTAVVYPLGQSKFWPSYRKDIRTSLTGFGIACGLILLLACANVSNLLLGRAIARRREIAMRLAIGAGRGRIVRQLLTESGVLAVLSCGAALAVAYGLMQLLLQFPSALGLPLHLGLPIDARVLAFCIAVSVLAVALFGLVPALQGARLGILPSLKDSGNASAGRGSEWFRNGLVALQAALTMILLIGGGLYGRALLKAYAMDLGFRSDHLLTAEFTVPPAGRTDEQILNLQRTLLDRLSSTPGVLSSTVSSLGILTPGRFRATVETGPGAAQAGATCEFVGRDYFRTLGIALIEGRDYTARDEETGTRAIVNRALARALWNGGSPVGRTILVDAPGRVQSPFLVDGIAGDAKDSSVWERPEPHLYLPAGQSRATFLAVRTSGPPAEIDKPLRELWGPLSPAAPLDDIRTGEERVDLALTPQRVAAAILGGFALLALLLTAVGLYSVVAFSVARQKREIGIRIAMGASPRSVFGAILRKSMIPAAAGLAAGMAASFPLMRILAAKANNVSPYDEPTYLVVAAILAVVACGASIIPARRAMGVNPATALRSE